MNYKINYHKYNELLGTKVANEHVVIQTIGCTSLLTKCYLPGNETLLLILFQIYMQRRGLSSLFSSLSLSSSCNQFLVKQLVSLKTPIGCPSRNNELPLWFIAIELSFSSLKGQFCSLHLNNQSQSCLALCNKATLVIQPMSTISLM